jgi:acyl-CoA synthetase (AMP-forming)/AMP-acid ligase II
MAVAPAIVEALAADTLVGCLEGRGRAPDATAFWLEGLEHEPCEVRAGGLLERSTRAARGLLDLGMAPGDRVFLVLPTSTDFVFLLWGTLLGSATAVPAYPPLGVSQLPAFVGGLRRMIGAAKARFLVVPDALKDVLAGEGDGTFAGARVLSPGDVWAAGDAASELPAPPTRDDLALIQFSSGSTGEPRGVCLSHHNVLANVRAFAARISAQPEDVCVTWLPLYHDMGLIGTLLGTLMAGVPLVLFPPTDFLRQPAFWLRVLGKYRATIGVAPQFAYALCPRKAPAETLSGVDLSGVRVLLNGAEPIHAAAVEAFERHYRTLGLRRRVVTPCYGLAEGTLAATMVVPGTRLRATRPVHAGARAPGGDAEDAPQTEVVSCGRPMDGMEVRVVGPDGGDLPEGFVGEIAIRGPSVCRGILHGDGIAPAADADGWLRTRDLGFLRGGELYVTGRLKDVIIIGGRNYYPQDLEAVAAEVPAFRPGRVAAFGVTEPVRSTEVLVMVAETTAEDAATAASAVAALRHQLLERFGLVPYDTVLLKRGRIPITTSGKIRRSQTRTDYERDGLADVVYRLRPASPAPAAPADR